MNVQIPACDGDALVEVCIDDAWIGCRPADGAGYMVELTAGEAARISVALAALVVADVADRLRESVARLLDRARNPFARQDTTP